MSTPHAIIASSAAINKNLFTGTYAYALAERLRARVSVRAPDSADSETFSFVFLTDSVSTRGFASRLSLDGSSAKAYSCRCCTSSRSTGVVNTHSSTRSAEKETPPGISPPPFDSTNESEMYPLSASSTTTSTDAFTVTNQSRPSHISKCVNAATALMYATCRFKRERPFCAEKREAFKLNTVATKNT